MKIAEQVQCHASVLAEGSERSIEKEKGGWKEKVNACVQGKEITHYQPTGSKIKEANEEHVHSFKYIISEHSFKCSLWHEADFKDLQ